MQTLTDRVAVVTGAASGIGRATALAFARQGCALALVDRDQSNLEETERRCREVTPRRITTHQVDVADRAAMECLVSSVVAQHGGVHVLVNNAGVAVQGTFAEQRMEDLEWIVGVNLWGVVHGCKLFLPHLLAAEEAHIVNVSSVFGIAAIPNNSGYCLTKYAVRGLTEALWEELRDTSIGVTCVHPGGVNTNIIVNSRAYDQDLKQKVAKIFARHMIPPEEVAAAIVSATLRGKKRVLVAPEAHAIDFLKRLAPTWGNHFIASRAKRMLKVRRR